MFDIVFSYIIFIVRFYIILNTRQNFTGFFIYRYFATEISRKINHTLIFLCSMLLLLQMIPLDDENTRKICSHSIPDLTETSKIRISRGKPVVLSFGQVGTSLSL